MQIILLPPGSQAALKLANANLNCMNKQVTTTHQVMGTGFKVSEGGVQPVRKRQRLDHLTEQEKLNRRKLKNRVAAQTARDKKKAKMDELEIVVQQLRKENEKLKEENKRLKLENTRLKINHGETTITLGEESEAVETMHPFESAVLINGPLPQEQGCIPPQPLMTLLQLMLILLSASGHQVPSKVIKSLVLLASQSQNMGVMKSHQRTNPFLPQGKVLVHTLHQPP